MIFTTPRLIARRFKSGDLADFVAMRNDPEVARYQSWDGYSEKDGQRFLDALVGLEPGQPGWFQFALEDRETGRFIGDCGINVLQHDTRLAQIGYTIARRFWNQGYATETVSALVTHAFKTLPLHRITASVDARNTASLRVLEKNKFRKEAHFRQSEWFKGDWADDMIFALLRCDWPLSET